MSADTSRDVSLIHDEDILRKIMQDTEDFARKKEIRTQMSKLREARLKEFYNSGEVNTEIRRTTTSKSSIIPTHTESIADHSFASMKTKEIRDSESPTRDSCYRLTDKSLNLANQGWNVVSKNETSSDGKTRTSSKVATTAGSEKIQGGQVDFAAKNEQKTSVFQDGDGANFTKAVGASSNSVVKQEAVGGDENSSFKSSSTTASSSSRFVSESRSTQNSKAITQGGNSESITKKVYTNDVPSELKKHPGYVEGKTTVTRETRTLPDGSSVTTTRYEVRGGSSEQKTSKFTSSSSEQRAVQQSTRSSVESKREESNRIESARNDARSVESRRDDSRSIESRRDDSRSIESKRDDSRSTESRRDDSRSIDSKTLESRRDSKSIDRNIRTESRHESVESKSGTVESNEPSACYRTTETRQIQAVPDVTTTKTHTVTEPGKEIHTSTTQTTVTRNVTSSRDTDTGFVDSKVVESTKPVETTVTTTATKYIPSESYETPERRKPIKPGKSELDTKSKPTEGQYDTTYRAHYTNKRISVDVSPTHEAFARSLRAVSPDRISRGSPRTSTTSLRSSSSPEKSRYSPERRSVSPRKSTDRFSSTETITYKNRTGSRLDTSSSLTKKKPRSPSPSSTSVSDFEFVRNQDIITDLDTNVTTFITKSRPSSLDIKKGSSPTKEFPRKSSLKSSPVKSQELRSDRPLKRTDTYEERCRQILGITTTETRRGSYEKTLKTRTSSKSPEKTPTKVNGYSSPRSPTKEFPKSKEAPKQIRRSSEKQPLKSPVKDSKISEFPSQIRRSQERQPLEYPGRKSPVKDSAPKISEFPSQIRRSPERRPLDYPERRSPVKDSAPKISEFPSQIRRSPERQHLDYPEKRSPVKDSAPKISEFPSQIRRSPERQPLDYSGRSSPVKDSTPKINEFPSQIRRSPERQHLDYSGRSSPVKDSVPKISEFPSQIRRSPERQLLDYPERKSPVRDSAPKISEFPSQIRRSPERQPLDYPERRSLVRDSAPKISEFPSQIRRSPERQPLDYSGRTSPVKDSGPKINEFPSQIRRSPERQPLDYPGRKSPVQDSAPKISEFPSQIRRSPERQPLESPERQPLESPERKSPVKDSAPKINEFPSQIRRSPERQPLEFPEKRSPVKDSAPKISEFPSQIRRSPERQHLDYPEKRSPVKDSAPKISEFPSQIRRSPERQPLDYPERKSPVKDSAPKINEFPSQTRRSPERRPFVDVTDRKSPERKSPERDLFAAYPQKYKPLEEETLEVASFLTELRKDETETRNICELTRKPSHPDNKSKPTTEPSKISEFPSQIRKSPERELLKSKPVSGVKTPEPKKAPVGTKASPAKPCGVKKTPLKSAPKRKTSTSSEEDVEELAKQTKVVETYEGRTPVEEPIFKKRNSYITYDDEEETQKKNQTHKTVKKDLSRTSYSPTKKPLVEKNTTVTLTKKTDAKTKTTKENFDVKTAVNGLKPKTEKKPATPVKKTSPKPTTVATPKRHVVSTTINVTVRKPTVKSAVSNKKVPKLQNGHVSSEEDVTTLTKKITRTTSDQLFKTRPLHKTPVRGMSKPELITKKKVITTKSILINNDDRKEVVVELLRSKSSREPTPDQVYPLPVFTDDGGIPRYPDRIVEPDDDLEPDDSLLSVNKKINKFTIDSSSAGRKRGPAPKVNRPELIIDESLESDECLLSVSEKVNKFISTAEQLTASQDLPERPKSPKCKYYDDNSVNVSDKVTHFITTAEEVVKAKKAGPKIERSNVDKVANKPVSLGDMKEPVSPRKDETTPRTSPSRYSSPPRVSTKRPSSSETRPSFEETPKRRPSDEDKVSTGRLRSTETIKKAKALFENYSTRDEQRQRDILTRPSIFEGRKNEALKSTRLIQDTRAKSPSSEDGDTPGYMKPLDRSLRPHSPHRESMKILQNTDEETTKFGVTLKRTDGDQTTTTVTKTRISPEKLSPIAKTLTESEIDEIYDLELLDELLEKVVSYELRRKIRTQIRLVKKLIAEKKLVKTAREKSPSSKTTTQSYSFTEKTTVRRSQSPEKRNKSPVRSKSPVKTGKPSRSYSPDKFATVTRSKSPEKSSVTTTTITRSKSPEKTSTTSTTSKVFSTQLRKTQQKTTSSSADDVPEWVKARNLKKADKTSTSSTRVTSSSTNTSTFTRKSSRTSPVKEAKPTDIITSSYGVGPTDENGSPLFGLKALRARNDNNSTTTKIQGTVIKSQYYSENGNEPIGEISVTKYSNDPKDLGKNDLTTNNNNKSLTSITTTQKFGYKDTPSLKNLTSTTKKIEGSSNSSSSTTATSKFERRGSVKALSQKFIDNAVETLKNESKQTSYPKAGLILRTSSFKDTGSSGTEGSREGSPDSTRRSMTTSTSSSTIVKTSSKTTSSSGGDTFLTNRNRVSGVQDVITRMKTEDVREGDSTEDIEARGLLNKFLGSQVILSGLSGITESSAKTSTTTTTANNKSSGISGSSRKTTKITTTVTEGGKPTTRTRIFQHPITDEELESIWDEQTLRLLLEQSTDYEERRKVRARLRQVMAEQEACTDLVDKASRETISSGAASTFDGSITRKTFTEGPVTTTQVTSTRVSSTQQQQQISKKPISPFAKFRQLDKQNSINTPPSTPKTPSGSGPLFKFTDPALNQSANTIKDRLLYWCRMKTKEYENIQLDNFSSSWADGLAFCALIHHFLPDAFDYHALTPKNRRHNFTLAFQVADEKADIAPLLDVDDMVATRKPDWKCVFTYVQSIYRRFKDED